MGISQHHEYVPPKTQRAVVVGDDGRFMIWEKAPCPPLKPDQIYVRTDAVAINPSDTKMLGSFQTSFGILGTDFAGTVLAVGSEVQGVAVGDRICGATNAMSAHRPDRGAFGQYNVSAGPIWLKLPVSWSSEAGASLCAGLSTAGLAIRSLGLPLPDAPVEKPFKILVYGGSTATGTLAIQLLKLANLVPITTCSPKNFDLVKSYGAEEVFDYRDLDCAERIRTSTKNNLLHALDCITTVESTQICCAAIGRAGGRYVSLDPYPEHAASRKAVKTDWVLGPSIFGEECTWPAPYGRSGSAELLEFGRALFAVCQKLIDERKIRHHPLRVMEGDLTTVLEGIELLKGGSISAAKVVVRLTS